MSSLVLFSFVIGYFLLLLSVAWYTSRNSNNESFFIGNRNSNWMLVAFGMVGTMLSGVTFISVPGTVGANGFAYFQVVIGNWIGFMLVALVLLPLYYRERLTSLYDYLGNRFGPAARKTGAGTSNTASRPSSRATTKTACPACTTSPDSALRAVTDPVTLALSSV